jgi:hypothetical protein
MLRTTNAAGRISDESLMNLGGRVFQQDNKIDDIYNVLKQPNLNNYYLLYFLQIFKVWFVQTQKSE